jgi:hypothetical protein
MEMSKAIFSGVIIGDYFLCADVYFLLFNEKKPNPTRRLFSFLAVLWQNS